MPRSFTDEFTTRMLEAHQRPYLVLKVEWEGGTKYYIDREPDTYSASGKRYPDEIEDGLVVDWGTIGMTLRETQIGSVDSLTIKVEDRDGELTDILNFQPQQRKLVSIYRMFDEDDVLWPDSAALVFLGVTRPFEYSETDNVVTFQVDDPAKRYVGKLEKRATKAIFPTIPPEYENKNIATGFGYVDRAPCVLISAPWENRIADPVNIGAGLGSRIALQDHPDDLEITPDETIDCMIGPFGSVDGVMGLRGVFRQSTDKSRFPSYFEISGFAGCDSDNYSIAGVRNGGTAYAAAEIIKSDDEDKNARLVGGARVSVTSGGSTYFAKVIGHWVNETEIVIDFDNPDLSEAINSGDTLKVWFRNIQVVLTSEDPESTPRSDGDLDVLDAKEGQVQRVFYFDQPADFVGDISEMLAQPIRAKPIGATQSFPVSGIEADTPTAGTYRMTVEYNRVSVSELNDFGAGDTVDLGFQSNLPVEFPAGSCIRPADGQFVYAFNAFPSKELIGVFGYGDNPDVADTGKKDFIQLPERYEVVLSGDEGDLGQAKTHATAWEANLNNDTWNLTGGLDGGESDFGTNISTITFFKDPRRINHRLESRDIWVTYRGIDYNFNRSSTVIYNPADVLYNLLTNEFLLNVATDRVDLVSFTRCAESQELIDLKVGFAIIETKDGLELLQDIARQCRSLITFDQGVFSMKLLRNEARYWNATIRENSILQNSATIKETAVDDMPSRLAVEWRRTWDDKTKPRSRVAINSTIEAIYPVNVREFKIDIYHDPEHVETIARFWIERLGRIYREFRFETYGRALALQPADWIDIGYTDGNDREIIPPGTRMEVLSIQDKAPSGLFSVAARYPIFTF